MKFFLNFVIFIYLLGALSVSALTPEKESNLEYFPVTMTFKAFLGLRVGTKEFEKILKEHKNYNWIHAPGISKKKTRIIERTYPNKIITLQDAWGGTLNKRDRYRSWPGYWLYGPRTILKSDLSSQDTEVLVENAKKLIRSPRRLRQLNRRIKLGYALVIYRLDAKGNPDFSHAEQVGLLSVHGNRVRLKRALLGGKALTFKAGRAAMAAHIYYWSNQWQLNMSLDAPVNPRTGQTAAQWYADIIAKRVKRVPVDGIEFDVARWIFGNVRRNPLDCNNDGRIDNGYINGINSFGLGGQVFLKELRRLLGPDKIIQMDSNDALSGQRGWNYVNGVQMEAFPMSNHFDRFSEAFQYLRLWRENTKVKPALSYAFTKTATSTYAGAYLPDGRSTDFRFRMGLAADCLLRLPHAFLSLRYLKFDPNKLSRATQRNRENFGIFYWDEYFGGDLHRSGWLGKPTGPYIRHDNETKGRENLAESQAAKWIGHKRRFKYKSSIHKGLYSVNVYKIIEPVPVVPRRFGVYLRVPLKKQLQRGREYTLIFDVRGDDRWNYKGKSYPDVPRSVAIRGPFGYPRNKPASVLADSTWRRMQFSFTVRRNTGVKWIDFGCGEQIGRTEIKNIRLYEGALGAHWSRKFEHGLVLLNVSAEPWRYRIPQGERYRRLKGTQDPKVNNGRRVGPYVTIPGQDALFLYREP